jgi:hypothetical protein
MHSISTTYDLKWRHKEANEYQFDSDGICINTKRGRIVRQVLNGRSKGFCIRGKFVSLTSLRPKLEKIPNIECPF